MLMNDAMLIYDLQVLICGLCVKPDLESMLLALLGKVTSGLMLTVRFKAL